MGRTTGIKNTRHKIDRVQLIKEVLANKTITRIAIDNNWSFAGVMNALMRDLPWLLVEKGSTLLSKRGRPANSGRKYSHEQVAEYRRQGLSVKSISEKMGAPYASIRSILVQSYPDLLKIKKPIPKKAVEIIALRKSGQNYREIAEVYGVSRQYIEQSIRRYCPEACGKLENIHFRMVPCVNCGIPLRETPCGIKTKSRYIRKDLPTLCDDHIVPFMAYRRLRKSINHYQPIVDFIHQKKAEGILMSRIGEIAPGGAERSKGATRKGTYLTTTGKKTYADFMSISNRVWAFRVLSLYKDRITRAHKLELEYPKFAHIYDDWVAANLLSDS